MRPVDFAVIGAGASGMAAAVSAASCGENVILLEKNNTVGRKIAASGNGRCNLMNIRDRQYYGGSGFAEKVFGIYPAEKLIRFWNHLGIRLREDEDGRMYPCTFHSSTVNDVYKTILKAYGTDILLQCKVTGIARESGRFVLQTDKETITARRILVSCGGSAGPKLGGTDTGYHFLSQFGHTIHPAKPALCPLTTDGRSISGLSGIRVRCIVTLMDGNMNSLLRKKGEVLFTDYGISGICAMQTARFAEKGFRLELDFTGDLFPEESSLVYELERRQKQIPETSPETLLGGILVPRLAYAVMKQAGIEIKGRKTGDLTHQEIVKAAGKCRTYSLSVTGNRGMEEAQATAGGAECSEFSPVTMESNLVGGLHAAGEVLDVDGDCGGYNLMFATASGILAGLNGREEALR